MVPNGKWRGYNRGTIRKDTASYGHRFRWTHGSPYASRSAAAHNKPDLVNIDRRLSLFPRMFPGNWFLSVRHDSFTVDKEVWDPWREACVVQQHLLAEMLLDRVVYPHGKDSLGGSALLVVLAEVSVMQRLVEAQNLVWLQSPASPGRWRTVSRRSEQDRFLPGFRCGS